jgi:hypothetical protein
MVAPSTRIGTTLTPLLNGRKTHYRWLEDDANYAEAFKDAEQFATDHLETPWHRSLIRDKLLRVVDRKYSDAGNGSVKKASSFQQMRVHQATRKTIRDLLFYGSN